MKDFFQLMYKIEVKEDDLELAEDVGEVDRERESVTRQVVTLSCVGIGFFNYSKGIMWGYDIMIMFWLHFLDSLTWAGVQLGIAAEDCPHPISSLVLYQGSL